MKTCKSWRKYKGLREPKCVGGKGCRTCWKKYRAKQAKPIPKQSMPPNGLFLEMADLKELLGVPVENMV
jgi:hypothetical protein